MGGVALLERARVAGLTVTADGGRLVVRGPKSADALAREVLASKRLVLETLALLPAIRSARDVVDPRREDLAEDSDQWRWLLQLAWIGDGTGDDQDAYGALLYVRSLGAALVPLRSGAYAIRPRLSPKHAADDDDGAVVAGSDSSTGWATEEEWKETRKLLVPHAEQIARWLVQVAELMTEGAV